MFYSCKIVPQGDTDKTINLQNKMAVKVTKKVKYATALYHKINATRIKFYMESFTLFSKSAHLLDYAALLIGPVYTNILGIFCDTKIRSFV